MYGIIHPIQLSANYAPVSVFNQIVVDSKGKISTLNKTVKVITTIREREELSIKLGQKAGYFVNKGHYRKAPRTKAMGLLGRGYLEVGYHKYIEWQNKDTLELSLLSKKLMYLKLHRDFEEGYGQCKSMVSYWSVSKPQDTPTNYRGLMTRHKAIKAIKEYLELKDIEC